LKLIYEVYPMKKLHGGRSLNCFIDLEKKIIDLLFFQDYVEELDEDNNIRVDVNHNYPFYEEESKAVTQITAPETVVFSGQYNTADKSLGGEPKYSDDMQKKKQRKEENEVLEEAREALLLCGTATVNSAVIWLVLSLAFRVLVWQMYQL